MTDGLSHTPGPWTVEHGEDAEGRELRGHFRLLTFLDNAPAIVRRGSIDALDSQDEANLRLVTAAPALLEAAQAALETFESGVDPARYISNDMVADMLRAAIQQATEGQNDA